MNAISRSFSSCLALNVALTVALPVFAVAAKGSGTEPGLKIIVRVYNYARVSPKTQSEAGRVVTTIFSEVGVETLWLDCRLSMEDSHGDEACQQPFGPSHLVLRILPQCKTKAYRGTVGISLPQGETEKGFIANIFWDRIEALTKWRQISQFQILGLAATHELGHLLLGVNSHSPRGVMRANWNKEDLVRASQGLLHFTPQQSERIRVEVRARTTESDVIQDSELESAR